MPSSTSSKQTSGAATKKWSKTEAGRQLEEQPDDSAALLLSTLLDRPAELSPEDYADLLHQIRTDFTLPELQRGGEWLDAARHNDVDVVRGLLRVHPALLHHRHAATRNSALHMAAANGHAEIVELLLTVERLQRMQQQQQQLQQSAALNANDDDKQPQPQPQPQQPQQQFLSQLVNAAGNTALHWAAANGQSQVVKVMLEKSCSAVDVLLKNGAGRSALTEGFASDDAATLRLLLEHDSASEERLVATSSPSVKTAVVQDGANNNNDDDDGEATTAAAPHDSVTHALVFCGDTSGSHSNSAAAAPSTRVRIRELAMAAGAGATKDGGEGSSILGQAASGEQDATGFGIWAASLVAAQWMHDVFATTASSTAANNMNSDNIKDKDNNDKDGDDDERDDDPAAVTDTTKPTATSTILELGAGCGVPGLVAAAAMAAGKKHNNGKTTVYLTDFNATTVANLEHNIDLNRKNHDANVDCRALLMNWQDPSTWPQTEQQPIDVVIGSDLIYQNDMVPLLLQTLRGLRPRRFLYAAPAAGRQGHEALLEGLDDVFERVSTRDAPASYLANPLQSGDDEECFVHFHELLGGAGASPFVLYEFRWNEPQQQQQGND